jgi:hypothetical protein
MRFVPIWPATIFAAREGNFSDQKVTRTLTTWGRKEEATEG